MTDMNEFIEKAKETPLCKVCGATATVAIDATKEKDGGWDFYCKECYPKKPILPEFPSKEFKEQLIGGYVCVECGIPLNPENDKIHKSFDSEDVMCGNCYDKMRAEEENPEREEIEEIEECL